MHTMHINTIDLNLLRVFEAVYRTRNVSRAAEALGLTQPAVSHALTRLRLLLRDPLFVRAGGGVRPTAKASQLAGPIQQGLQTLQGALSDSFRFDPEDSQRTFRLHLSDIGESSFMPPLMSALLARAPHVRAETFQLDSGDIANALDAGRLDAAIGFLPALREMNKLPLINDRYVVLVREGHPLANRRLGAKGLAQLEYVMVRSHSDTLRILALLKLEGRVRMATPHFLAAPGIVRATDLAVIMPRNIARGFARHGGYVILEPRLPLQDFSVVLHWSHRTERDPANLGFRHLLVDLFQIQRLASGD
ncbi:MAG: LysR family transcriptional regulator [Pigmentiphaga sp.]